MGFIFRLHLDTFIPLRLPDFGYKNHFDPSELYNIPVRTET